MILSCPESRGSVVEIFREFLKTNPVAYDTEGNATNIVIRIFCSIFILRNCIDICSDFVT